MTTVTTRTKTTSPQLGAVFACLGLTALLTIPACGEAPPGEEGLSTLSAALVAPTLPAGWNATALGTMNVATTANFNGTTGHALVDGAGTGLRVTGAGADNVYYVNRSLVGDGEITAQLGAMAGNGETGGIMIRSQLNTSSSHAAVLWDGSATARMVARAAIGGPAAVAGSWVIESWMKLVRRGNVISSYHANSGGTSWTPGGSVTLSGMGAAVSFGMFVSNGTSPYVATGFFDHVWVGKLPPNFLSKDIGTTGATGSTSFDYDARAYNLSGAGAGLKGTVDGFQFAYRTLVGDGTVVVRIEPPSGPEGTKGGLMLRNNLNNNASHVLVSMDSSDNLLFTSRASAGANTPADVRFSAFSYTGLVKLTRTGTTVSTFAFDGGTWRPFLTRTLTDLGSTVYVGFACTSGTAGSLAAGSFDSFEFLPNTAQ